jgi:hypothetical protein
MTAHGKALLLERISAKLAGRIARLPDGAVQGTALKEAFSVWSRTHCTRQRPGNTRCGLDETSDERRQKQMNLTFEQARTYYENRLGRSLQARDKIPVSCLFHEDRGPSATVFLENGWLYCHSCGFSGGVLEVEMKVSGCDRETAWKNIAQITGASLNGGGWVLEAAYFYRDAEGVFSKKLRYRKPDGEKTFVWYRRDSAGRWQKDLAKDTPRLLYNQPELTTCNLPFFAEGEGCADALSEVISQLWPARQAKGLRIAATTHGEGAWKPKEQARWRKEYTQQFGGKPGAVLFEDNDEPGRTLIAYVAAQIYPLVHKVRIVTFRDKPEKYDIKDWIEEHKSDPDMIAKLERMIEEAPFYKPPQQDTAAADGPWAAEGMDTFLASDDREVAWLVRDVLAPGCLTQIFAPRGVGKSLLADHWAVALSSAGKRVLVLDRDNPRHALRNRLRSLGAGDLREYGANLKVISREKCPPLTRPDEWAAFPCADYDVVIVDSLDAMAEGIGEQDSSKPARAIAPLLDICHRENGPALLLLGNTIKSAEHSRGSGVVEDRADIVFEVRDATDFKPSGNKPWIEELPAQGAGQWAARSSRRKTKTIYRLAVIATKFRLGEEPAPRMFEVNLSDEPWSVRDVTADIDKAGEAERLRRAEEKAARIIQGIAALLEEIDRLSGDGQPPILKTAATAFLMAKNLTRKESLAVIASDSFSAVPGTGKGHPIELHRQVKGEAGRNKAPAQTPAPDAGFVEADFCRPPVEHTAEMEPSETRIDKGDSEKSFISPGSGFYPPKNEDSEERI